VRPLRIVHIIESLRPGGAEQLLLTSLRHLDRHRFDSDVVALWAPLDIALDIEALDIPVHHLGLTDRAQWWRALPRLVAHYRRVMPDIVHTHLRWGNVYGRLAAIVARVPAIVSTLHNLDYSFWPPQTRLSKLVRFVDGVTARHFATGFVAVSAAVRDDYRASLGLDVRRVDVIHNYVERLGMHRPAASRADVLAEFGWTTKTFVLLNVGRLAREKGHMHVIGAMPAIMAAAPEARLLIVGDGPDEAQLRAEIQRLGLDDVVMLPGKRRDVANLLAAADVFVFPSIAEGFGIAAVEAMAAGVPVIVTRAGGLAEIVEDGVTGLVVPTADPVAIAAAVIRLYGDASLRQRLVERARASAFARFTAEAGVARLQEFYNKLAAQAPLATRLREGVTA
jgi:glycosyltransferase involved in cell wall biosynthesis